MTGREENRGGDRPEDTMSAPTERELAAQLRVLRPAPAAWIAAAAAIPQGGLPAAKPSAEVTAPEQTIATTHHDSAS
jgi:hypothetical protein